jgi:hypothetical protein
MNTPQRLILAGFAVAGTMLLAPAAMADPLPVPVGGTATSPDMVQSAIIDPAAAVAGALDGALAGTVGAQAGQNTGTNAETTGEGNAEEIEARAEAAEKGGGA